MANAREELGFVDETRADDRQQPKHSWKLIAESPGVQQHRCVYCRVSRTRTVRAENVPLIRYLKLGRASDSAPPCLSQR
jgi:hypothetical protein